MFIDHSKSYRPAWPAHPWVVSPVALVSGKINSLHPANEGIIFDRKIFHPTAFIMKSKILFLLVLLLPLGLLRAQPVAYPLPKVLFLTTGDGAGRGTVSDGVVLALQSFNKMGIFVRLENKSVLLQPEVLRQYQIIIAPTIRSYHDLPLPEALTFLSDAEMINLSEWVKNGGVLVAGENIGRNTLNRKDRLTTKGVLDKTTWPLAECFGVEMKEINTGAFALQADKNGIWSRMDGVFAQTPWRLVPVKPATTVEVMMHQTDGKQSYPALTVNRYGNGKAVLLPTFRLLHPQADGGLSTAQQIDKFYQWVVELSTGKRKYPVYVNPWKDAHTTAYCQTFDDGGTPEQYRRIIDFINRNNLPTVFFVTPHIRKDVQTLLQKQKLISLQGHSFNHPDFRKLNYGQTLNEFLLNRNYWHKRFTGFRFPYVSNSFWGMYVLDQLGFTYETSIAANHLEYIRGSVVPYNIPVFKDDFYVSLDLLELSQIYRSDWYFYQKVLDEKIDYNTALQKKDADRFRAYLFEYFNKVVKPNKGVMVYLGHPMYSGISKTTLQPLQEFIDYLKTQNVWIASANTVAERWNKLKDLNVWVSEQGKRVRIEIDSPSAIEGLSIKLPQKPENVLTETAYRIVKREKNYYLIFDAGGNQKFELQF